MEKVKEILAAKGRLELNMDEADKISGGGTELTSEQLLAAMFETAEKIQQQLGDDVARNYILSEIANVEEVWGWFKFGGKDYAMQKLMRFANHSSYSPFE